MKKLWTILVVTVMFILITTVAMSADFRGSNWGITEAEVIEILGKPDSRYLNEEDEYIEFTYSDVLLNKEYTTSYLRFSKESSFSLYMGYFSKMFEYEYEANFFLIPIVNALDNKYGARKSNDYAWTTLTSTIECKISEDWLGFFYAKVIFYDKTYYSIEKSEEDEMSNL